MRRTKRDSRTTGITTLSQGLKFFVGTWNVNAEVADEQIELPSGDFVYRHIRALLMDNIFEPEVSSDFVVIGLQELVELSPQNVIGSTVGLEGAGSKINAWHEVLLVIYSSSKLLSRITHLHIFTPLCP